MKANKKYLAGLGIALLVFILLKSSGGDNWVPPPSSGKKAAAGKESYLELRQKAFEQGNIGDTSAFPANPLDPFKSKSPSSGQGGLAKSIKRTYALKGILLKTPLMAVVLDNTGESHVVSAGDIFCGVKVVQITSSGVTLKDAYGEFSLEQK